MHEYLKNKIKTSIKSNIFLKEKIEKTLKNKIIKASIKIIKCLKNKNKIMICGNGGSACDSMHFSSELINKFKNERPALPAISLNSDIAVITSISNDLFYEEIFSRQIEALGNENDILILISTSGNSKNLISAIKKAKEKNIKIIAMTGNKGGLIKKQITNDDINICIPSNNTARIQESHIFIIHCMCEIIDKIIFNI